jgi:hypothetical protein
LITKYTIVKSKSHGTPAINVSRMPSTHHVVIRIATMAAAPISDV